MSRIYHRTDDGDLLNTKGYRALCERLGGNPYRKGRQIERRRKEFATLLRWKPK